MPYLHSSQPLTFNRKQGPKPSPLLMALLNPKTPSRKRR